MKESQQHIIKQQVLEASVYLQQGLFAEAENIYIELLDRHQQLLSNQQRGAAGIAVLNRRIQYFKKQISVIRQRARKSGAEISFDKKTRAGALIEKEIICSPSHIAPSTEKEEITTPQEHRLREDLGTRYEELATQMMDRGALHDGINMLQHALDIVVADQSKARIYQKIGLAHENLNDVPAALAAYQKAGSSFKRIEKQVFEKIKPLTNIIKEAKTRLFLSCRFPKFTFCMALIMALLFMAFIPRLKTVDNVDYFNLDDEAGIFYQEFKTIFGNDEFFVIAYKDPQLFSARSLALLRDITNDLEEIEGLEAVNSLGNINDIVGGADYFEVTPFIDEIPEDAKNLLALKKRALANRLYVGNLIAKNGNTAAIVVEVYNRPDDQGYRKRMVAATQKVLDSYKGQIDHFYLAGGTTTNLSLSQYLQRDMAVFVPITFFLVILTMWLFFRNIILTALAFANIGLCVGATVGLMGWTGVTLNNVSSIVVPLVMALALCDTVHIFAHLDRQIVIKLGDKVSALSYVLKRVYLPCLLTSVTTGIGFISLSVSQLEPIREFAWIAGTAMIFEFIFSFFFLGPLLLLFSPEKIYRDRSSSSTFSQFLSHLGKNVEKHSRAIAITGAIIVIVAMVSAANLRVETNVLAFFRHSSPVRIALDWVGRNLSGVMTLDVALYSESADAFKEPKNLKIIEAIQNHITTISGVDKTVSFVDFIKDMNESFHSENAAFYAIPDTMEAVSQYMLLYDSDDIEDFINTDFDKARISVRLTGHSSSKNGIIIDNIRAFIDRLPADHLDIRVTGEAVDVENVSSALVKSQIYSLALAAAVIAIVMALVFRSIKLGAISLIPNLFPIILNFGIMGIAGIPLDTGTALIAAIAMGIAVDDTIHFLSEYQAKRKRGMPHAKALRIATLIKGRAVISSSVILCVGFVVLVLSRFVPIIHFGFLCAIIMISAIIGDFVVLPAVILLKARQKIKRTS